MTESPKPPPIPGKKPILLTKVSKRSKRSVGMEPIKEEILSGAPLPPVDEKIEGMDFDIDMATGARKAFDIQSESLYPDTGDGTVDQQTLAEANAKRRVGKDESISTLPARPELSIEDELFRDNGVEGIDEEVAKEWEEARERYKEISSEYYEILKKKRRVSREIDRKIKEVVMRYDKAYEKYYKDIKKRQEEKGEWTKKDILWARNQLINWKIQSEGSMRTGCIKAFYSMIISQLSKMSDNQKYDEHLEIMMMFWAEKQLEFWKSQPKSQIREKAVALLNSLFLEQIWHKAFLEISDEEFEVKLSDWIKENLKFLISLPEYIEVEKEKDGKGNQERIQTFSEEIKHLIKDEKWYSAKNKAKELLKVDENNRFAHESLEIIGRALMLIHFYKQIIGKMAKRANGEFRKSMEGRSRDEDRLKAYVKKIKEELVTVDFIELGYNEEVIDNMDEADMAKVLVKEIQERDKRNREYSEERKRVKENIWRHIGDSIDMFEEMGGEVYEEKMGLRKIRLEGKYNFIDRNNHVVYPTGTENWFDSAGEFQVRAFIRPILIEEPVAWIKTKGGDFYLTKEGQLLPASIEDIEAGIVRQEIGDEPHLAYIDVLIEKFKAFSKRFNPAEQKNFEELILNVSKLKSEYGQLNWQSVIERLKALLGQSGINMENKIYLSLELARAAMAAGIDSELNGLSELLKYDWFYLGVFGDDEGEGIKGAIVRINLQDRAVYNLFENGRFLYPVERGFDHVDVFVGNVAVVRRGVKYNFISKENGQIIENEWFDKIHKPKNGMFRVERKEKFNYMHAENAKLISRHDFDKGYDFDNGNRASVMLGKREFSIDENGIPLDETVVDIAIRKFVDRRVVKPLKSEGSKPSLSLKERIEHEMEDIYESQIGYKLHQIFEKLLKTYPKETDELIRLFSDFRKKINKEACGEKIEDRQVISKIKNEIEYLIINSKLTQKSSDMLRSLIGKSAKDEEVRWYDVKPMPVTLFIIYQELLRSKIYRKKEAELIRLIVRMEADVKRFANGDNFSAFSIKLEKKINKSNLPSVVKEKFIGLLWKVLGNGNIDLQWRKKLSVIEAYSPRTASGKRIQQKYMITRGGKSAVSSAFEAKEEFSKICKLAESGKLELALKQYKSLSILSSKFKVEKLADAVYRYFYVCWLKSRKHKKTVDFTNAQKKVVEILKELARLNKDVPKITYHLKNIEKFLAKPKKRRTIRSKIVKLIGIGIALSVFSSNPDCTCSNQVGESIGELAETIRKEAGEIFDDIDDFIKEFAE